MIAATPDQITGVRRHRLRFGAATWLGVILVAAFALVALAGSLHGSPNELVARGLEPPSAEHPFGTDTLGHDLLARTGAGARTSLIIALSSIGLAIAVSAPLGLLAAWNHRRWPDLIVMRMVETTQIVPQFILALLILGLIGTGDFEVLGLGLSIRTRLVICLAIGFVPFLTRITRAAAVAELEEEYVTGLRLLGVPGREVLWREVAPNVAPAVGVQLFLAMAIAVFAEGGLSFLGLGIPAPHATLGNLIAEAGGQLLDDAWWYALIPGLVLVAGITGFNLLADAATEHATSGRAARRRGVHSPSDPETSP